MKKESFLNQLRKNKILFLMLMPSVILAILMYYMPLSGLIVAFKNFRFDLGIFGSEWVGLENFRYLFLGNKGLRITWNTILYNVLNITTHQILGITIAIALTEMKIHPLLKRTVQSCMFLPYFVSWVVVGMFASSFFNSNAGLLNKVLNAIGLQSINVYAMPDVWKYIIPSFYSWKWAGYVSIIYIAAIMGLDQECFEAADIDGANSFQRIWHITLPGIRPTIVITNMVLLGKILRGDFQMFFQLIGYNGQLYEATDVIDTFVFRSLMSTNDFGMTSAASFYQSVVCLVVVLIVNWGIKKIEPDYALF